jgi:hypothetical protein
MLMCCSRDGLRDGLSLRRLVGSPVGIQCRIRHGHHQRCIGIDVNMLNQAYNIKISKVQVNNVKTFLDKDMRKRNCKARQNMGTIDLIQNLNDEIKKCKKDANPLIFSTFQFNLFLACKMLLILCTLALDDYLKDSSVA